MLGVSLESPSAPRSPRRGDLALVSEAAGPKREPDDSEALPINKTCLTAPNAAAEVLYCLTKDSSLHTRHLVVYNTGPAVGIDLGTLRRVFEAYGSVERLACPNPSWSRVYITFEEVESAVRAKAERNRPPEVEEKVRKGVPRAAEASDVFAPKPGEPCPLLGRWLKVAFADMRIRPVSGKIRDTSIPLADSTRVSIPVYLKDFKALDALAAGGAASTDCRQTPCPLCARPCGGQRGLRMHLVNAHPAELPDREHLVQLLKRGSDLLPSSPLYPSDTSILGANGVRDRKHGSGQVKISSSEPPASRQSPKVSSGAASKGRAYAALPPAFIAAREGNVDELRRWVRGIAGKPWDPKTATDKNGSGPLDWAAGEGRLEVCRYLVIECGVDHGRGCMIKGRGEGRTPLHWAARGGHEEVCRFFLDTPRPACNSPLEAQGNDGNGVSFVTRYLDPDIPAAEGTTSLHWACWGAHLSTCRLLVSRGADHRRVNAYGCNVAHWCGLAGDVDVCRWLANPVEEGGAGGLDWGKTNLQGHTICHKAALKGHRELLEWLRLQTMKGAVPHCAWGRDQGGYFPRDISRLSGHLNLAEWMDTSGRMGDINI